MVLCKVFAPDKSHKHTQTHTNPPENRPPMVMNGPLWLCIIDTQTETHKLGCMYEADSHKHAQKHKLNTFHTHTHTNQSFCHRTWERFKDASLTPIWRHLNSKTVEQQWERNLFHSGFSFIYSAYLPSGITTAGPGAAALFIQMEQRIIRLEPSNPEAWSHLCVSASACF